MSTEGARTYKVRDVLKMKLENGKIMSKIDWMPLKFVEYKPTWHEVTVFPEGINAPAIQEFREKNKEAYQAVLKEKEKHDAFMSYGMDRLMALSNVTNENEESPKKGKKRSHEELGPLQVRRTRTLTGSPFESHLVCEEVQPGAIHTEPNARIVFGAPFDQLIAVNLKVTNSSGRRIAFDIKMSNLAQLSVDQPSGVLEPSETVLLKVAFDASAASRIPGSDRITIEWMNAPEGSAGEQFDADWFEGDALLRRKSLQVEYNE